MGSQFKQSRSLDTVGDAVTVVLGTRFPEEEERGSGQLTAPNPFACRDPGPAQAGADTASAALRGEAGFPGTRARGRHGGSLSASYAPEPRARTPRLSTRAPPPRAPASGTGRRRGRERRRGNRGVASARRLRFRNACRVAWARVLSSSSPFNFLAAPCNAWHLSSPTRD